MNLVIVTGMSGAGKSQAVAVLEDMGYYCVDNVPPSLLSKFAELSQETTSQISKMALVVDVRSKDMFADFKASLETLTVQGYSFKTLFLDCSSTALANRYKETRRRHPLLSDSVVTVSAAIEQEAKMLLDAKNNSDFLIDTTLISSSQLKGRVQELFFTGISSTMVVNCVSFGFKHGIPTDSDLAFDVRCLPNPFYIPELKNQTGLDIEVEKFVLSHEQAKGLVPHLFNLVDYLLPLYETEGKSQLVVSIGCTGGHHRSVVFAQLLGKHIEGQSIKVNINHRDINK